MNEKDYGFTEYTATSFEERQVNFDDLYDLFIENIGAVAFTKEELLRYLAFKIMENPCLDMRFHFRTKDNGHICAIIKTIEIAERLKK